MPTRITPGPDYLDQFPLPLWAAWELEGCKPILVVEGTQDGFDFRVVELTHSVSAMASRADGVTTFFILSLKTPAGAPRYLPPVEGNTVFTDGRYLYLARERSKVRVRDWTRSLNVASAAAEAVDAGGTAAAEDVHAVRFRKDKFYAFGFLLMFVVASVSALGKLFFFQRHVCVRSCGWSGSIFERYGSFGVGLFELLLALAALGLACFSLYTLKAKQRHLESLRKTPPKSAVADPLYGVDKSLLGMCQNCRKVIELTRDVCPRCEARLGEGGSHRIEPLIHPGSPT